MTDPLVMCQHFLNAMNRQRDFMEATEEILERLRDVLDVQYDGVHEECSELEDDYDDWVDALASVIGNLWVPGLIEDAIEIAQCTSALGNWENTLHNISLFEERLAQERQAYESAQAQWLDCLHDAMTLHR